MRTCGSKVNGGGERNPLHRDRLTLLREDPSCWTVSFNRRDPLLGRSCPEPDDGPLVTNPDLVCLSDSGTFLALQPSEANGT